MAGRVGLSKSILEMKFMKRTKDKVEKQAYQEEGEEYFGAKQIPKRTGRYMTGASYAFCEELVEGRLSFQGENPELERLIELEELEKQAKQEKPPENEADVSDAEMAARWRATTKINIANMNVKRELPELDPNTPEPKRKKPKFLKPVD